MAAKRSWQLGPCIFAHVVNADAHLPMKGSRNFEQASSIELVEPSNTSAPTHPFVASSFFTFLTLKGRAGHR